MTFSRLDFEARWDERIVKTMFLYLGKFHTPVRTSHTTIKKMARYDYVDMIVDVKHYNKQEAIDLLKEKISRQDRYSNRYNHIWEQYIEILENLVPSGVKEVMVEKKKIYPSNEKRKYDKSKPAKQKVARENIRRYFDEQRKDI